MFYPNEEKRFLKKKQKGGEKTKMVNITILDNGGKTFDRYTVIIDKSTYTMSMKPLSPNGFNQYGGELGFDLKATDITLEEGETRIDLNDEVIKAILERV